VYGAGAIAVPALHAQRGATLGLVHLEARRVADAVALALSTYRAEQRAAAAAAAAEAAATAASVQVPRPEPAPPAAAPVVPRQPAYQAATA
jgi:hypothetical protein